MMNPYRHCRSEKLCEIVQPASDCNYSSTFSYLLPSCLLYAGIVLMNNDHSRAGQQSHAH